MQFECPESIWPHLKKVFDGEYAIPYQTTDKIKILDIGGNCGAFALWAKFAYPNAEIHSYEPFDKNCEFFKRNTANFHDIHLHQCAVGDQTKNKLYVGKNNCGEGSQYQGYEQLEEYVEITVVDPSTLPSYEIVKLDCEGAEEFIIPRLDYTKTKFIMFEYHSDEGFVDCSNFLVENGFRISFVSQTMPERGIAKFRKKIWVGK